MSDPTRYIKALSKLQVSVGWHSTAKYPDGTPVAEVAAAHELGVPSKNIPPRPTLRPSVHANRNEWGRFLRTQIARAATGANVDPHTTMALLGEHAAGAVREAIAHLTSPPLRIRTIRQRLHDGYEGYKPLVKTRLLYSTVTSEVTNAS